MFDYHNHSVCLENIWLEASDDLEQFADHAGKARIMKITQLLHAAMQTETMKGMRSAAYAICLSS